MKRIGLFLTSLVMIFMLTACGGKEKQLECIKTEEQGGITAKQVFNLNFKSNGKFKSANLVYNYEFDDTALKLYDLETYKNNVEVSSKQLYEDYKITIEDGNKLSLKVNFDDIESLGKTTDQKKVKSSVKDYEDFKKSFENLEFTCTVK